jgi:hypothetical protein
MEVPFVVLAMSAVSTALVHPYVRWARHHDPHKIHPASKEKERKMPRRPCHGTERQAQNPPHRLRLETPVDGDDFDPFSISITTSSRQRRIHRFEWTQRGSRSPAAASSAAPRPPRGPVGTRRSRLGAGAASSTPTSTRSRGRGPGCRS